MVGRKHVLAAGCVMLLCLIGISAFAQGISAFAQEGMTLSEAEQNVVVEPGVQNEEAAIPVSSAPGLSDFQDVISTPAEAPAAEIPAVEITAVDKTTEWLWGEVVNIDLEKKKVVVKHLDYETYEDVKSSLMVDDKTVFENVADFGKLKVGDHVSVDYTIQNGANVAGLIVVEREEKVIEAGQEQADPAEEKVSADTEAVPGEVSAPMAEPQAVETPTSETTPETTAAVDAPEAIE